MKEQLEQALVDVIVKATNTVEGATTFLVSQAPDVVQQLLRYELITSIIVSSVSFGIFVVVNVITIYFVEKHLKENEYSDARVLYIALPLTLLPLALGLDALFTALKIWIAPKIFLIEYAAQLVK